MDVVSAMKEDDHINLKMVFYYNDNYNYVINFAAEVAEDIELTEAHVHDR